MNNQNQTKESMTEEEIIEKLKKGKNVQPPDVLLRSILNKLPNASPRKNISSPYASFILILSNYRKSAFASALVLMLIIVGGITYKLNQNNNNSTNQTPSTVAYNNNVSSNNNVSANSNGSSKNTSNVISPQDTSDAALSEDLGAIDAQLNGLNSDNANADKGLSNQNI